MTAPCRARHIQLGRSRDVMRWASPKLLAIESREAPRSGWTSRFEGLTEKSDVPFGVPADALRRAKRPR